MNTIKTTRIESLDLLKGLVMVIMALDHVRDYFHYEAFFFDPTDPDKTNAAIYFTRWITHYCAPAFSFLAGISAFLVGRRKSKKDLSLFLLSRGIWLVFIEVSVVGFAWFFDIEFGTIALQVIWSLGISMIVLALFIHLPLKVILIMSLIIIFGHNALDYLHMERSVWWGIVHEFNVFRLDSGKVLVTGYPLLPWIGVMSLGYYFGKFYDTDFSAEKRRKAFNIIGIAAIMLFFTIRLINGYGNPKHWQAYEELSKTVFSFMDPLKYPPSLAYLLMTLGPALLVLANTEQLRGRISYFFKVFGRVPFFYYILHLYVIHGLAVITAELTGFGWESMILKKWVTLSEQLDGYGFSLPYVYLIWILVVLALYPLCKKFSEYKMAHKEKKWLSYF